MTMVGIMVIIKVIKKVITAMAIMILIKINSVLTKDIVRNEMEVQFAAI